MRRIDEIVLREIEFPLHAPFRSAAGTTSIRRTILVEVHAGDVIGVGECAALPDPKYTEETLRGSRDVLVRYLLPLAFALHDLDVVALDDAMSVVRGHPFAKSALATAVLDADAARRGRSVADRWAGGRSEVPAGVVIGGGAIDERLRALESAMSLGVRRAKLKIAPGDDVDMLRAARSAYPTLDLAADANGAYGLDDPVWDVVDACRLSYVEEPFPRGDWSALASYRSRHATPVALDESVPDAAAVEAALALGAVDVVNIKLPRVGGPVPARAIHDLAVARGVPAFAGGMLDSCVGRAHHLAFAALPGCTLPGDVGGSDRYTSVDLVRPPIRQRGDVVPVPRSSVAASLDSDVVARVSLRVDRFERTTRRSGVS